MVQRVYRQLKGVDKSSNIVIATSKSQVSSILNQLGDDVSISIEPGRRDTFPAIVLASQYLVDELNVERDEVVVVCPVDPYVDDSYFEKLKDIAEEASKGKANIVLMGIEPTYPSEKYGYIIPSSTGDISLVKEFKEKPTLTKAEEYIREGALWNGGVFAFKLGYILDKARKMIDFSDYDDLFGKYETLEKISFDYAVVEHEKNIEVVKYSGEWKDIGTWNTLTESMSEKIVGKGVLDDKSSGVHIINELDVPILAMGLKDVVISASVDGILVSDKSQSSYIKPYVDRFEQQVMYAEKSWGSFKVLSVEKTSLTIIVTLNPGHSMNYHSHKRREEVWVVISGNGKVILDGSTRDIKTGDVIKIPVGAKHMVTASTELKLIEVQIGEDISISDKEVFKL